MPRPALLFVLLLALGALPLAPPVHAADPPGVVDHAPVGEDVSLTAWIVVRFNATMNRSALEAAFTYAANGTTFDVGNGSVAWDATDRPDDTFRFNPHTNFAPLTIHEVRLNGSLAVDAEGVALDGDGDGEPGGDYTWAFRTEATDDDPPVVLSVTPADGATGVPVAGDIVVTFSENMDTAAVEAAFRLEGGGALWTVENGVVLWNEGQDVLTFSPSPALAYATTYAATLNGSVATDLAGNGLDGDGDGVPGGDHRWSFTTQPLDDPKRPVVVSTYPVHGMADVPRDAAITVVFSKAMDRPSVVRAVAISGGILATAFTWSGDTSVTFEPDPLFAHNATYVVTISDAARDVDGNPLVAVAFSFRTVPWRGTVNGVVLDADGTPVGGATVRLGPWEVATDLDGRFAIPGVPEGTYDLLVVREGYEPYRDTVAVGPSRSALPPVVLQRSVAPALLGAALVAVGGMAAVVTLAFLLRRRPPVEAPEEYLGELGVPPEEPPKGT